jgi:hypothetical protein
MAALCLGALGSLVIDQWNAMEKHIRQMEVNDKPDASWRRMMIREIGDFIRADSREGLNSRLEAGEEQAIEELRGKTNEAKRSFAASALRTIKTLGSKDPRSIRISEIIAEAQLFNRVTMEPRLRPGRDD